MTYTKRAFRKLSEEGITDGVYIDLNKDNAVSLKALQDRLDGNEANMYEIEKAMAAEFDPVAEASYIIYTNECNYNMIMECIGMHELNEAVSGRVAVFSEADHNGLIERAKEMIRKLCEKVALFCKKAILKIASHSKIISNYVSKNKNAIENGASMLGDDVTMSNVSVYPLKKLDDFASNLKKTEFKTKEGIIKSILKSFNKIFNGGQTEDLREKFLAEMRDGEVESTMTVKEYIARMGGITTITASVTASLSTEVNAAYKKFESESNAIIKDLNRQRRESDGTAVDSITKEIEDKKEACNTALIAINAYISACLSYIAQNVKAISACKKAYKGSSGGTAPKAESVIGVGRVRII